MVDTERKLIKVAIDKRRSDAVALRDKVVDVPAKSLLAPVLQSLTFADDYLSHVKEDGTSHPIWLAMAERWLHVAEIELKNAAELIDKYGGPGTIQLKG